MSDNSLKDTDEINFPRYQKLISTVLSRIHGAQHSNLKPIDNSQSYQKMELHKFHMN